MYLHTIIEERGRQALWDSMTQFCLGKVDANDYMQVLFRSQKDSSNVPVTGHRGGKHGSIFFAPPMYVLEGRTVAHSKLLDVL